MKRRLEIILAFCFALASSSFLLVPLALAQQSNATAAVDATDVADKIINQIAAIAMIGGGVLLLIVAAKVFWWLRLALAIGTIAKISRRNRGDQ